MTKGLSFRMSSNKLMIHPSAITMSRLDAYCGGSFFRENCHWDFGCSSIKYATAFNLKINKLMLLMLLLISVVPLLCSDFILCVYVLFKSKDNSNASSVFHIAEKLLLLFYPIFVCAGFN